MRELVMRVDGYFLVIAGLALITMGLASYAASKGPLRDSFAQRLRPAILNWVEAFGLAMILGVIFIFVSSADYPPFWNVIAAATHLFMAAVNVVFWRTTFVALGIVVPGATATVAHVAFVLLQVYSATLAS